jgi:hypothetical protein
VWVAHARVGAAAWSRLTKGLRVVSLLLPLLPATSCSVWRRHHGCTLCLRCVAAVPTQDAEAQAAFDSATAIVSREIDSIQRRDAEVVRLCHSLLTVCTH